MIKQRLEADIGFRVEWTGQMYPTCMTVLLYSRGPIAAGSTRQSAMPVPRA